jgi:hypothetical protein
MPAGADAVESCRGAFMNCSGDRKTPETFGIDGVLFPSRVSISP